MSMTLGQEIWGMEEKDWNSCGENIVKEEIRGGSTVVVAISTEKQDMNPCLTHLVIQMCC